MLKYSSRPQTPNFQYIFLQWVGPYMYTRFLSLGGVRGQYSLLYTTTQVFLTKWWDKGKCWSNWYSHNKQLLTSNETDRKYNSYTRPRELILTHTPLWLNKGLVYVCQFWWSFGGNTGESVISDWQNNIYWCHKFDIILY